METVAFGPTENSTEPFEPPMEMPPVPAKGTAVPLTVEALVVLPPKVNISACWLFQSVGRGTAVAAMDEVVAPFQIVAVPVASPTVSDRAWVICIGQTPVCRGSWVTARTGSQPRTTR